MRSIGISVLDIGNTSRRDIGDHDLDGLAGTKFLQIENVSEESRGDDWRQALRDEE